jgi:hypothetical protein
MSISPVSSSTSSQAAYQTLSASLNTPNISTLSVLSAAAAQQTQQVNLNAVVSYQSTSLYGSGLTANQFSIQSTILNTYEQINTNTQQLVAQLKADAEQAAANLADLNILDFLGDVFSGALNLISNAAKTLTDAISGLFGIVVGLMSLYLGFTSWRIADQQVNSSELIGGPNAALTIITSENSLNALIPYSNPGNAISKIGNLVNAEAIGLTDKLSVQNFSQTVDAEKASASVAVVASSNPSNAISKIGNLVNAEAIGLTDKLSAQNFSQTVDAEKASASVAVVASAEAATIAASATVAATIQPPRPLRSETTPQVSAPHSSPATTTPATPALLEGAVTQTSTAQLEAHQITEKAQAISALNDLMQIASLEKHHLTAEAQQAKLLLTSLRNSANASNHHTPQRKD